MAGGRGYHLADIALTATAAAVEVVAMVVLMVIVSVAAVLVKLTVRRPNGNGCLLLLKHCPSWSKEDFLTRPLTQHSQTAIHSCNHATRRNAAQSNEPRRIDTTMSSTLHRRRTVRLALRDLGKMAVCLLTLIRSREKNKQETDSHVVVNMAVRIERRTLQRRSSNQQRC